MPFDIILGNSVRAALGPEAVILALAAIGLNVHYGYCGLQNFGQVGFMALGAYGTSVAVSTFGWSLWIGIPVGLFLAFAFAVVIGFPTLKLREDYFAIATVASAEIIRLLIASTNAVELTGGPYGVSFDAGEFYDLNPFPDGPEDRYGIGTLEFNGQQLWLLVVGWTLVVLVSVTVHLITHSPWGRVIKSIREEEDAVRSLGKNTFSYKMQALAIGGVIGGLAGVVDAVKTSGAFPTGFLPQVTVFVFIALLLGGAASTIGPVFGAMLFWFLREWIESSLRHFSEEAWLPDPIANFLDGSEGIISIAFVGLALILIILYRPQGIWGNRSEGQVYDE